MSQELVKAMNDLYGNVSFGGGGGGGGGGGRTTSVCVYGGVGGNSVTTCTSRGGRVTVTTCVGTPTPAGAQVCHSVTEPTSSTRSSRGRGARSR